MKIVILKCGNCGKEFERRAAEAKRCASKGFSISCSRSCGKSLANKRYPEKFCTTAHLPKGSAAYRKPLDDFSAFRYFLKKARAKDRLIKYGETDLTLQYLRCLWADQKGICPYTHKHMHLPESSSQRAKEKQSPSGASLDRIDSTKGYIQGNVEFVCLAVNYAKNKFSKEDIIKFFKLI